jgi:hypothetical protein
MDVRDFALCEGMEYPVHPDPLPYPDPSRSQAIRHLLPGAIVRLRAGIVALGAYANGRLENFLRRDFRWVGSPCAGRGRRTVEPASATPTRRADRFVWSYVHLNRRRSSCISSITVPDRRLTQLLRRYRPRTCAPQTLLRPLKCDVSCGVYITLGTTS